MNDAVLRSAFQAHQAGNAEEATRLCVEVLRATPKNFIALNLYAFLLMQAGRFAEAERVFAEAITINPSAEVFYNRGCALQSLGRFEEALTCFQSTTTTNPDFLDGFVNRGIVQLALRRYQDALVSFDIVVTRNPGDAEAWNNRANALIELDSSEDALESLDKALALDPQYTNARNNRGVALQHLNRHADAFAAFDRALAIAPNVPALFNNRGNSFMALRQYEKAYADFERATALNPNFVEAVVNRATVLIVLRRMDEAIAVYDRALRLQPGNVEALRNRANAFVIQKQFEEASRDCEKLLLIDRDYKYMRGILAHTKLQCCDWSGFTELRAEIESGVRAGRRVIPPFENFSLCPSAADQLACARIYAGDKYPVRAPLWQGQIYRHGRIRLAYLSADFRNHAVASLMAGVFEHHDKSRFEVIGFSFGSDKKGAMRSRVESAFERFADVERLSDADIAARMRDMEIDIVVDLTGYTGECRPGIYSLRPAPVQVNYLGFAGTMGSEAFDYIIADRMIIPQNEHAYYSEKIVYLPDVFLNYESRRTIARVPTRREAGLPETGFVFCSFNNAYKFSSEMFQIWMRILHAVPGSVLWLPQGNDAAMRNLAHQASVRGIASGRIVFAPFIVEGDAHLARMGCADLFLDTLPYNAHTTAADALWAGLPLLTCKGTSFAGRVAASLLNAAGIPEMITDTPDAYERRAIALARDPAALGAIRDTLARNRVTSPLFDTARFTRHLESAYIAMWERQQRGAQPASFAVPETTPHAAP